MKYNKYPSYKDSGVDWLGEIPSEWNPTKLKYGLSAIIAGGTPKTTVDEYWCSSGDGIPWVSIADMTKNNIVYRTKKDVTQEGVSDKGLKILPEGTILYSIFASLGKVAFAGTNLTTNQAILGLVPNSKLNKSFFYWVLIALEGYVKYTANSNTQDNLNSEKVANFPVALPLQEQQTIANYLDIATAKIDTLIEKQTRLIELLKEKRQAVISTAVTRGLDSSVAMKDSGVEWLGEIPVHWDTVAMKLILDIRDGTHDTPSYIDDGLDSFPLVTSKDFVDNSISFSKTKCISKKDHILIRSRSKVDNGDVLMSMIGGNIGKSLIANVDREISIKNVALFKTSENPILAQLLLFYLDSYLMSVQIDLQNRGGAQGFLSLGDIRNLVFPKIPLMEQKAIVTYLTDKTSKIDNLITKATKAIDLLKEKRTALISAVVTGKIDVRGEVA